MKNYKVQITETLQKTLTIKANNAIEAKRIVENSYQKEDVVLDHNDHIGTLIYPLVDFCSTKQLIRRLKIISPQILECNLQISGLNATHYICIKKNNQLYDEGIDGKIVRWNVKAFLENYTSCRWIIDYVE